MFGKKIEVPALKKVEKLILQADGEILSIVINDYFKSNPQKMLQERARVFNKLKQDISEVLDRA